MSFADEARTWTSVTGISTWYRIISTSEEAALLETPYEAKELIKMYIQKAFDAILPSASSFA